MARFSRVPVMTVNRDNFEELWPGMVKAVETSSFIAMDCEMSGLGNRRKLNDSDIEERYKTMIEVAQSRSIISLGISCFRLLPIPATEGKQWTFLVQTYNIPVLSDEDYIVEPLSLKFLVSHGFNFQEQYASGLPYYRGQDKESDTTSTPSPSLRSLFTLMLQHNKALVLHNAPVDLVFLYAAFYSTPPPKLGSWITDLTNMFSTGGLYDSKYIADYVARLPVSFLEYTFKKTLHLNSLHFDEGKPYVKLMFPVYGDKPFVEYRTVSIPDPKTTTKTLDDMCERFAYHGYCPHDTACKFSHDVDDIIATGKDMEAKNKKPKRKPKKQRENENKKLKTDDECNGDTTEEEKETKVSNGDVKVSNGVSDRVSNSEDSKGAATAVKQEKANRKNTEESIKVQNKLDGGGHRAGYDAFMTGYSLAVFLSRHSGLPSNPTDFLPATIHAEHLVNKLYLTCKDHPMLLRKSNFSKPSQGSQEKLQRIRK